MPVPASNEIDQILDLLHGEIPAAERTSIREEELLVRIYGYYARFAEHAEETDRLLLSPDCHASYSAAISMAADEAGLRERPSREPEPHFRYFGTGRTEGPAKGQQCRIYLNACPSTITHSFSATAAILRTLEEPFEFKIPAHPADFARADNFIIYLHRASRPRATSALAMSGRSLGRYLRPQVPRFTRQVAPGIAWGESPRDGSSFGQQRAELLATTVAHLWRSADAAEIQEPVMRELLARAGYYPENFHLNPIPHDDFAGFSRH
ncbi:T3SS effector HopA1 family protein [Haloferula sp. BvORR071]|uniref:T3SS effector HopA1 family protein n=1 Tax=Haloferula sp. BvORR071 TaxID=1396141 RepID=UPI00054FD187|nr:T3SS effector HopA1 family protein [Haloferula sp. BvORR071]